MDIEPASVEQKLAAYNRFLMAKMELAPSSGVQIEASALNPLLKPHQADIVQWAVRGGRRAIFAAFGLGKSIMQIETARLIRNHTGGRFLQVAPLGVRHDLTLDASLDTDEFRARADELSLDFERLRREFAVSFQFVQKTNQIGGDGFYLTNYESVRDGKINMDLFDGVSLDEASILRGFGGTKTFRELMRIFEGTAKYRFVATATPSPNEFIELLAYAAFLDINAKSPFFTEQLPSVLARCMVHSCTASLPLNTIGNCSCSGARCSSTRFMKVRTYPLTNLRIRWGRCDQRETKFVLLDA